jgi:hypothetical protein
VSTDLAPMVSMVDDATSTKTKGIAIDSLRVAIKHGRWKEPVEEIRRLFHETRKQTGDRTAAKKAVAPKKKKLEGIIWTGLYSERNNRALERHSGCLCVDLDDLDSRKEEVRQKLCSSPYVLFMHASPTGEGFKAVFSVVPDASKHTGSFRAIQQHVRELTGVEVDTAASDLARISFASWDPLAYYNPKAKQIEPLPEPEKPLRPRGTNVDLSERQRIAEELLGAIDWQSETSGIVACPGKHLHTAANGERDCKIELDGVPTVHCFHNHCRGILDGINHQLRKQIGKAEFHAKQNDTATRLIESCKP